MGKPSPPLQPPRHAVPRIKYRKTVDNVPEYELRNRARPLDTRAPAGRAEVVGNAVYQESTRRKSQGGGPAPLVFAPRTNLIGNDKTGERRTLAQRSL